jgi:hypothetical protein
MNTLRILPISIVALGSVLVPTAQASTNVVPNAGFEQSGCSDTPIICGWQPYIAGSMYLDGPHSGNASMRLAWSTDFYTGMGPVGIGAQTDPAFCVSIGPGVHPASFWYVGADGSVSMGAAFYQGANCTGPATLDSVDSPGDGEGWQQVAGTLTAPPGTQSALFSLSVSTYCDYAGGCSLSADFDDLDVEDAAAANPAITSFSPMSGPVGTSVDIEGPNLAGATGVDFNGTGASFTVDSDSEIHATVPSGATTGPIAVITPGGTGTSSSSFTMVADTTPPDTMITSGPPPTTTASSASFQFTASEPSTFECSLDTDAFTACTSPASYSGLVPGVHTFRVRAIDTAGNADPTPAQQTWTVQANTPPTARFMFICDGLTCHFDGTGSTDADGTIASYIWDFGDATSASGSTADHAYPLAAGYVVTLTVTDDGGATGTTSNTVTPISLSARGYRRNALDRVDLAWNGHAGTSFDVYRDGSPIATVQANSYTDNLNKRGSSTDIYEVCATAFASCSNTATVSFLSAAATSRVASARGTRIDGARVHRSRQPHNQISIAQSREGRS